LDWIVEVMDGGAHFDKFNGRQVNFSDRELHILSNFTVDKSTQPLLNYALPPNFLFSPDEQVARFDKFHGRQVNSGEIIFL